MSLIEARELTVRFGDRTVLDAISIEVLPGDVLALTGRSGSGKTTLLLALAGLLRPDAGAVTIAERRAVLYVPQAPSLVPELSAKENVMLAMRLRGTAPAAAAHRAEQELGALDLTDAAEAMPHELSGGMAQRVALARALALDPTVLLVDEPTGALDRATGAQVLHLLRERTGADSALLVATHDPEVTALLGRHVQVDDGHLLVPA